MRLQNIYDSIPNAIDRVVEEVVAKYEWVDVENKYKSEFIHIENGIYKCVLSASEMQEAGARMLRLNWNISQAYPSNLLAESMAREAAQQGHPLHNGFLGGIFG